MLRAPAGAASPEAPSPEPDASQPPQPPQNPTFAKRAAYAGLPGNPDTAAPKPTPPQRRQLPAPAAQTRETFNTSNTPYSGGAKLLGAAAKRAEVPFAPLALTKRPVIGKRPGVPPAAPALAKRPRPTKRPTAGLMPSIPEAGSQAPALEHGVQPSAAKPVSPALRPAVKLGGAGRTGASAGLLPGGAARWPLCGAAHSAVIPKVWSLALHSS